MVVKEVTIVHVITWCKYHVTQTVNMRSLYAARYAVRSMTYQKLVIIKTIYTKKSSLWNHIYQEIILMKHCTLWNSSLWSRAMIRMLVHTRITKSMKTILQRDCMYHRLHLLGHDDDLLNHDAKKHDHPYLLQQRNFTYFNRNCVYSFHHKRSCTEPIRRYLG